MNKGSLDEVMIESPTRDSHWSETWKASVSIELSSVPSFGFASAKWWRSLFILKKWNLEKENVKKRINLWSKRKWILIRRTQLMTVCKQMDADTEIWRLWGFLQNSKGNLFCDHKFFLFFGLFGCQSRWSQSGHSIVVPPE